MSAFQADWERLRPGFPAIGYKLREGGAKHWVRFHSLPASKRYPESRREMDIVLSRADAMARYTLGHGDVWLVQADGRNVSELPYDQAPTPAFRTDYGAIRRFGLTLAAEWIEPDEEGDPDWNLIWRFYAGRVRWSRRRFTTLMRNVAKDVALQTLWISPETGAVFSPYDGGADLFLPSEAAVVEAKRRWATWLPRNESGM